MRCSQCRVVLVDGAPATLEVNVNAERAFDVHMSFELCQPCGDEFVKRLRSGGTVSLPGGWSLNTSPDDDEKEDEPCF